jgi:single-strand DNA-binding protein
MSYHSTTILGNLGKDPELRYLPSGVPVADFSVAVSESWNDRNSNERKEKTTWYRVSCFGQLAETVSRYLAKGRQVLVIGTVEARAYMDKSGQPAASLELRAQTVRFVGNRGDNEGGYQGGREDFAPPPDDMSDIPF